MLRKRKPLWYEGMLTMPHHFQQWDDYQETTLHARIGAHVSYPRGLLEFKLSEKERNEGRFMIERLRAVMDDGLMIDIPDQDSAPKGQPVGQFFDLADGLVDVHLAIPEVAGDQNFLLDGDASRLEQMRTVRYVLETDEVFDQTIGRNRQRISFARTNIRVMFGDESRVGYRTILIARLRKTATSFELVPNYVPPLLDVKVSPWLDTELSRLTAKLHEKRRQLGDEQRHADRGRGNVNPSTNSTGTWLLYTINVAYPVITLLQKTRLVHPLALYTELTRLGGALSTFASANGDESSSDYDHDNLYQTFNVIFKRLHDLLDQARQTDYVVVQLKEESDGRHTGTIQCPWPLDEADFFLGISANTIDEDLSLLKRVPAIVRVASISQIESLIIRGVSALPLHLRKNTGLPFPVSPEFHYFKLQKTTDGKDDRQGSDQVRVDSIWKRIKDDQNIAVFATQGPLRGARFEMFVCKPKS